MALPPAVTGLLSAVLAKDGPHYTTPHMYPSEEWQHTFAPTRSTRQHSQHSAGLW